LHESFSSRNKAAETIKSSVRILYLRLWEVIKNVLIKAALIIGRLCQCWVHTSWGDSLGNHAMDPVNHSGLNIMRGITKICVATMQSICACIIHCVINVSCMALTLSSTPWSNLWWDPKVACFPGRQTMVDGHRSEGNQCQVDYMSQ